MIPALATTGVAVYNVGGTFNSIMFSLTIGVSSLLSPATNRMVFQGASNEELTDLSIRVGRIQGYIMALIVSGFISFGKPFIRFYAGEAYMDAYWVAVFMMVPNMIPLVQSVCLNIIVAQNKHKFRSIVYLGIAILNVFGTWFLMQYFGIVGAAFMTGAALIVGQGIAMNWYYHKRTGLDMIRFWKQMLNVYLVPIIMSVVMLFVSTEIDFYRTSTMLTGIVVFAVVYCVLCFKFTMNSFERNLLIGRLRSIRKTRS